MMEDSDEFSQFIYAVKDCYTVYWRDIFREETCQGVIDKVTLGVVVAEDEDNE